MDKAKVKKALECCCDSDFNTACRNCPYLTHSRCNDTLCKDALNLINEQENEIERLRTILGQCNTELNSALESLKSQCREIGELKAKVKQAQIDVLNKVKEHLFFGVSLGFLRLYVDELIEEVENEKKD